MNATVIQRRAESAQQRRPAAPIGTAAVRPQSQSKPRLAQRRLGLAAIAVLLAAGVVRPAPPLSTPLARVERAERELRDTAWALQAYWIDTGHWPGSEAAIQSGETSVRPLRDLECLTSNVHGHAGWNGPYLEESATQGIRRDPWGRPYQVFQATLATGGRVLSLYSPGANGEMESSFSDLRAGRSAGDDLVVSVTAGG
jgi:general secretion pathway protein G